MMNIKKKGQLKMAETIGALFVFFILLSIGLLAYMNYKKLDIQQKEEEYNRQIAVETALRISSMYELSCTTADVESTSCVDILKLNQTLLMLQNPQTRLLYSPVLSNTEVTLYELYPEKRNWSISKDLSADSNYDEFNIPVNILDPISEQKSYGYYQIRVGTS